MKIFKKPFKKSHLGGGSSSSSSEAAAATAAAPAAVSPTSAPDQRPTAEASPALSAPDAARTAVGGMGDMADYYSSEEEFQVQLALALSASNTECRVDPDGDQIRAATLLSLGRARMDRERMEEGTAESLSRRYWDYNVLDYNEKVVDGFYDVYGLSSGSASQEKMPSLVDLQTSIGDLGFEVIVVNRAIDSQLVELEQIAQCISLDSPASQVALLVQRISELVTENMGGPVRDANDFLTRWMEKSIELRTAQQTSLLPIGCIKTGLSRHRALLFKVLADNVGIPCRLVKGSHYTGIDDDAVNIIKMDNEREFLVDLMAAPGTLIPADGPSTKDAVTSSYNPRLSKNLTPWATNNSADDLVREEPSFGEDNGNNRTFDTSGLDNNTVLDKRSRYANTVLVPSVHSGHSGASSTNVGSSSSGNKSTSPLDQANYSSSTSASSSKQKEILDVSADIDNLTYGKFNMPPNPQDIVDPRNLFADLNPFQMVTGGKASSQLTVSDNVNTEFQRRRENIPSGPARTQLPLVWKNRAPCNVVPNKKQVNFVEGNYPKRNVGAKDLNMQSSSHPTRKGYPEDSNFNTAAASVSSYSPRPGRFSNEMNDTSTGNSGYHSSTGNNSSDDLEENQNIKLDNSYALISVESSREKNKVEDHSNRLLQPTIMQNQQNEHRRNVNGKHDRNKCTYDRFMEPGMLSKDSEYSLSSPQARPSRLDPMLDDVAECEISWEVLVIGERIGLGSYGEVYRADWNGREVAVKKFLDQDFYGDALDEFRSEVRIMRRLRHPNVVLFLGAVTRPPHLSIVSEFLPRGSLYRILHRPNSQIDERRRIKMALDVAKGMNCLHTSIPTIVHRDLKSPNLLVDKNWTVKVCDFGLSRLKHNTFLSSKSTAGTPEWMAPEVLRNEPSNEKCDVYSFGVILWELATLRMPWSGMNPMQVVGAVGFQDRRLDIPKEVDPIVARIIWECWQTDPSLRPSFAQLAVALKPLQRLVTQSQQDMQNPALPQEISVNSTP